MSQPLSRAEVEAIRSSFAEMEPLTLEVSRRFYHRLFEMDSSLLSMFHGDLRAQGQKLMDMLDFIVTNIDNHNSLVPAVRELGIRHVGYGVKSEHYELVGRSLVHSMKEVMGSYFSPEAEQAWERAYQFLSAVMIKAAESSVANKAE